MDLISKSAAINTTFNMCCRWDGEDRDDLRNMMLTAFQELPTVDPVKHGRWIKIGDCNTVQCSECFDDFDYIDGLCYLCHGQELPNYCPNCGAKMERSE